MEWVDGLRLLHEVMHMEYVDAKGRTHVYEWVMRVPLNGNKDAPLRQLLRVLAERRDKESGTTIAG